MVVQEGGADERTVEEEDARATFRPLIIFAAMCLSFAHGANDTANATGAFTAVWLVFDDGLNACGLKDSPVWIMVVAGGCVFLGMVLLGSRVMTTIGKNIAAIDMHSGFCMSFGSTMAVVVCTVLQMPVSTTHCQVGAVVFVGAVQNGIKSVNWSMFGPIGLTWVTTIPAAALMSALFTALFGLTVGWPCHSSCVAAKATA